MLLDADMNDEVIDEANDASDAVIDAERFNKPWADAATEEENAEFKPIVRLLPAPPSLSVTGL